jgi:uncharacterized protein DUF4339
MQVLFSIAMSVFFAWGCAHHARFRGRNPMAWFFAGAMFGLFALIALFILPMRSPITRSPIPAPPLKLPALTTISPLHAEKLWYYLDEEKKQFGPMSFHALSAAWNEGAVRECTFVWNEVMENWQRFNEVIKRQET